MNQARATANAPVHGYFSRALTRANAAERQDFSFGVLLKSVRVLSKRLFEAQRDENARERGIPRSHSHGEIWQTSNVSPGPAMILTP